MFEPYDYSRLAKGGSPTAHAMRRYYTGSPAGSGNTGNGSPASSVSTASSGMARIRSKNHGGKPPTAKQ